MRGYHVLAHRAVDVSELLGPGADSRYLLSVGRCQKAKRCDGFFCHWFIFERDCSFAESHGPERFSLMYICAEGVSAYELLYSSRSVLRSSSQERDSEGTGLTFIRLEHLSTRH